MHSIKTKEEIIQNIVVILHSSTLEKVKEISDFIHNKERTMLSINEAAAFLAVHPSTIRRAIKENKIKSAQVRNEGRHRIAKSELLRLFQREG